MTDETIRDLITGKPIEGWAQEMIDKQAARHSAGGFTARFNVTRTDGKPIDAARRYIVLDYAGSDPHAIVALHAYAASIARDNPEMAADLRNALVDPEKYPAQHD